MNRLKKAGIRLESREEKNYITGLDVPRLLAAICVVAIHSYMEYGLVWDAYVVRILTRWAVPFFFMITGYFLKEDGRGFAKFWFKILCLYTFWTIVYALVDHYDIWNVRDFLSALRSGLIMPFWYFPSLLICSLFVFVLVRVIKDIRVILVICAVLFVMAMMGHTFTNLPAFAFWNQGPVMRFHHRVIGEVSMRDGVFWGSLFIAIGYAVAHEKKGSIRKVKTRTLLLLLIPCLLLYAAEIIMIVYYETGGYDITLFTVPLVLLLFLIARSGKLEAAWGIFLRQCATYIFLLHYFFLEFFMQKGIRSHTLFFLTLMSTALGAVLVTACKQFISRRRKCLLKG